jgi:hypothetical protein
MENQDMTAKPVSESAAPTAQPLTMPPLTIAQREKCRDLIEAHFDRGGGFYRGDWSDQKIARDVGCGYARVAELREIAYGPLRGDPVAAALRAELDVQAAEIKSLKEMVTTVEAAHAALRQRLQAVEAKFKP